MNPLGKLKSEIAGMVSRAVKIPRKDIKDLLEKPPEGVGADLALPCFVLAKRLKKKPKKIAKGIAKLKPRGLVKEVKAAGPYANFYVDWERLGRLVLKTVLKEGNSYGSGKGGRRILVEHTSANPDGPIHLGHFRNSVIGDSLARILRFSGNKVSTISWVNDTGRQIAIAVREFLNKKYKKTKKPDKKPDWWVLDLYLNGNKKMEKNPKIEDEMKDIIRRFESGDRELRSAFSFLTGECIKGHKETLSSLGISMDSFFKESQALFDGSVNRILNRVKRLSQGKIDKGRLWVNLKRFGVDREFTLTREDGTTIYPARDLAFHQYKFSKAEKNINVIGTDQKFYFKQLVSTLGLLFPKNAKNYHVVFYEFLLLPEGTMSTRSGKFISMDEVMKKALGLARKTVEKKMPDYLERDKKRIAEAVGTGALKYAMVKVSPEKTYSFSIEDALRFEGDNAPYIQYTHARACSILHKGKTKAIPGFDASLLNDPRERAVIKLLGEFPDVVQRAVRDSRPHYVANYAYSLAGAFNEFYQKLHVLKASKNMRPGRLALVKAVKTVLGTALDMLGIEAPERM
jgi:arginyl-tRNA synthetase